MQKKMNNDMMDKKDKNDKINKHIDNYINKHIKRRIILVDEVK